MKKKAIVVQSGGMDSALCLALAIEKHSKENVLSISFNYNQRHSAELDRAKSICDEWRVEHVILDISCLSEITDNALTNKATKIEHMLGQEPNTLVVGRNGLMARVAGIHANHLGASEIYMGVIEVESANSGYRDCSRDYMDLMEQILRIDFNDPDFKILTPIIKMTKMETMQLGDRLGVLSFLLEKTITCYEGIEKLGCGKCPSCRLRNQGLKEFCILNPEFSFSYREKILDYDYKYKNNQPWRNFEIPT